MHPGRPRRVLSPPGAVALRCCRTTRTPALLHGACGDGGRLARCELLLIFRNAGEQAEKVSACPG